ncbi:nicotinate-nucleotide pyrophosphorylase [Desulfofarcimen acetoxidans DSM 771]|uniref:Probable nicotinate-nucleotide pyrophosphorylase [carboxylating] n=1 Tax=Desulfofarcimen acetoxidans (strain ATCC 49208 / DSM 771 / KCTC 5769 / VKM B-1644 / 5575) TaxID=485916 RepID=C8VZT8_DESAS|nr:carboxylating nicotinate-nucleotide diphosphorylase [Desulfofarcimen acetoxidans]ACV63066.1 nicotinate-nucleotide pyrophosphorylase [Desulfofarcimen acetoxidans DSM 771]
MNLLLADKIINDALLEDIGRGDITTKTIIAADMEAQAVFISRNAGIVAGLDIAGRVFEKLDPHYSLEKIISDGDQVQAGEAIARVSGKAHALLSGERVALNFLQHLSGIATETRNIVEIVKPFGVRIADTRKTTPGLRMFEKYAVTVGGGYNHRMGLDDAVLIKDNHLQIAGGVKQAVELVRNKIGHLVKIEVEVETWTQLEEAVQAGVDVIMLDNMNTETMQKAVKFVGRRAVTEASGQITAANAGAVAATGVDVLSLGWITHSARPLDISLEIEII